MEKVEIISAQDHIRKVCMQIGVIEGFFGPAWEDQARLSYADFLPLSGGSFYIYAPKQDPHLRKGWRDPWGGDFLEKMNHLCAHFHDHGIQFGVALSPFGLGDKFQDRDKEILQKKILLLQGLNIDILGVFFDDMPVQQNLAEIQAEVMAFIRSHFHKKIIFCPSFYCFDPILEKVFGKKPDRYLEDIGEKVSTEVALAWTGPKVISEEITRSHLQEVKELLNRDPFVWENFFANDGPKNCKFLKMKPFTGRSADLKEVSEGWGLNMMNQPELSKIAFLSAKKVLQDGQDAESAFREAVRDLTSPAFGDFLLLHYRLFLHEGLDRLTPDQKQNFIVELASMPDAAAKEILAWLNGEYLVGSECLTD